MQLMSISGAARNLGYKSRSELYKLIDDGWLDDHLHINMPSGQRLLDVEGLQEKQKSICQWRIDSIFLRRCSSPVRSDTPWLKELYWNCSADLLGNYQIEVIKTIPHRRWLKQKEISSLLH